MSIQSDDVVVLDVRGCQPASFPDTVPRPDAGRWFVLLDPQQFVPGRWVRVLRSPIVEPIMDEDNGTDPYERVVGAIALRDSPRRHRVIEAIVRELPAGLVGARELVTAVLADPQRIRRPSDLARAVYSTRREIYDRCRNAGISRTEHLLTYIRGIALVHLTRAEGLSMPRARRLLGIGDPSNFRRQWERTGYIGESAG